uniref:Endonuclease/exonuclease/phosphatase domain-containing protein n=1 Tax=Poecilia mexicana TaxID=48701 RepID=A0A3B3YYR2_9TELE
FTKGRFWKNNKPTKTTQKSKQQRKIYTMYTDSPLFFKHLFTILSEFSDCQIIIGGNFNTVLNPSLDKKTRSNYRSTLKSSEIIKQYMREFEFTLYSSVHHSYSWIDMFLISIELFFPFTTKYLQ